MKKGSFFYAIVTLFVLCFCHTGAFGQGSLTPPGSPAQVMKSLDQIEPRIPIDSLHTPGDAISAYVISAPGSYYAASNLVAVAGKTYMITIKTNNVSIDLCGFLVTGQGTMSFGIEVPTFQTNIVVRNGTLSRFNSYGVDCANVYGGSFERLTLSQNVFVGLACGRKGLVQDCFASGNAQDGFYVGGYTVIKNCMAQDNGYTGIHVFESGARIEANQLIHNGLGLKIDNGGNLVIRNSGSANITNSYAVFSSNTTGPIINSTTIGTNSNPHANYDF